MPRRKPKDPERSADLPHHRVERLLARLDRHVSRAPIDIAGWEYRRARYHDPESYDYLDDAWRPIAVGEAWGGPDTTVFFRATVAIPRSHRRAEAMLDIRLDGGEALVSVDGVPRQGLDWNRSLVPIGELAVARSEIAVDIEAFVVNYPYDDRRGDERDYHAFAYAGLVLRDRALERFLIEARMVLDAYTALWRDDGDDELEEYLLHHLLRACSEFGPASEDLPVDAAAVGRARETLDDAIFDSGLFRRPGTISICAHSHLDIIYLWPVKETLRKNCRTVTNALSLMSEFPEYRFSWSQPWLYEQLKRYYPRVYAEVRDRIAEGRWEAIGAMYVEPDGNLPGAESMVRQILFGKRFLRDEFGIEAETCWLPDVFGVMYTLPQILAKSGIRYFSSVKPTIWNDTNEFPYNTFRWRGPDGSEVIAHFPPTHFGQDFSFENLSRHWTRFREKYITGEALFVYGPADGGGGPTREMVASSARATAVAGLPETRIDTVESFFRRLEPYTEALPVWDDEIYLEAHRGTYTTRGDLKRRNRSAEFLYRDAEVVGSIARLVGGPPFQERLNEGWRHILFNQFHDSLPGTHVSEAREAIDLAYREAFAIGKEVLSGALAWLADRIGGSTGAPARHDRSGVGGGAGAHDDVDQDGSGARYVVFNTLSWERGVLVPLDLPDAGNVRRLRYADGTSGATQEYDGTVFVHVPSVPSLGWTTFDCSIDGAGEGDSLPPVASMIEGGVETARYRLIWDETGAIASLYDIEADREVLDGAGNRFQLFEDDPGVKFSAWDVAHHIEDHSYPVVLSEPWHLVENGPLFAVLASSWTALDSTIHQRMWLYRHDRRIDFKTGVSWRNTQKLLKVAFPLAVRSRSATYDLPFGSIERPTHRNTDWDRAKFEVCGHKWADMSEHDYGVALLTDSKYGYDAREHVMRISLLRSPVRPDATSDIGEHEFTYAVLPHVGDRRAGAVTRAGYELNSVPVVAPVRGSATESSLPTRYSALSVTSPNAIVETIKGAEDGDGLIVRTYEAHGGRVTAEIRTSVDPRSVEETDLLERCTELLPAGGAIPVAYGPYEIKTHRVRLDDEAADLR